MSASDRVRLLVALLVAAVAACGGDEAVTEAPADDGSSESDDEVDDDADEEGAEDDVVPETTAARSRDASTRADGGAARAGGQDAGDRDGGPREQVVADAGRADAGRADAGTADAGAGDGAQAPSTSDVPSIAHCAPAASWDAAAAAFEVQVLALTNEARAAGHNCDTKGSFGPAGPLKMQPALRCAARLHSKYMAETGDFNHVQSATKLDLTGRLGLVSYRASTWGENIAYGQRTAAEVVDGWLDSDGHCANIMNPRFTEIGIGYVAAQVTSARGARQQPYWTQNFGAPR